MYDIKYCSVVSSLFHRQRVGMICNQTSGNDNLRRHAELVSASHIRDCGLILKQVQDAMTDERDVIGNGDSVPPNSRE